MNAMVLDACAPVETAPLAWREMEDPLAGPGEIRVRVHTCGICRTDLHVIEGELPPMGHPVIPGHQIVGTIDQVGSGTSRFQPGDRVGIAWLHHTCGQCVHCENGRENLCETALFTGYHVPGGYAELAVAPEDFVYPIPPIFSDTDAAPLLCAGIIGYRSLRRSRCRPGQTLALYGFGSSAHIVIQIALHWGCVVYVCTRNPNHLELAVQLGATWAGSRPQEMPAGADSAIVFAPSGELVPAALKQLRRGGTLALAGIYMTDIPSLQYEEHLFYEKNLCSVTANTRQDGLDLLENAARIFIRPKTDVFHLAQANEALLALKTNRLNGSGVLRILDSP